MTSAELNRAIEERRFPPLLFLYGEETYFLEKTLNRLRDLAVPSDVRDFNYNVFQGRELQAEAVLDCVRTLPVFASHRMVLIKDAQNIPAAQLENFLPYLKQAVPESLLTFVADKVDGRKKFFQDFKKYGELVEFKKLYDNQIPSFIKDQAREAGRSFTEDGLALFCRRAGSGLQEIHGELIKLFAYLGERTLVDVADVAAVVSDARVDSVFDFTNALGRRDDAGALRLLGRLFDEGAVPLVLLTMIVRHFRQLWKIRELLDQDLGPKEIARQVGVNPYFLDGLTAQARRFNAAEYRRAFELFLKADLALKSSGSHPNATLEQLVMELVSGRSAV